MGAFVFRDAKGKCIGVEEKLLIMLLDLSSEKLSYNYELKIELISHCSTAYGSKRDCNFFLFLPASLVNFSSLTFIQLVVCLMVARSDVKI